jgi:integrase
MSVSQLKDGRWIVYFRPGTLPDDPKRTREYFGRGLEGERMARDRDDELHRLHLRAWTRRTPRSHSLRFEQLVQPYVDSKMGSMSSSTRDRFLQKMASVILPIIGPLRALNMTPDRMDRYVIERLTSPVMRYMGRGKFKKIVDPQTGKPRMIKRSTIHREISDIKAVLSWAANPKRRYIAKNPLDGYEMPQRDDEIILPPTKTEVNAMMANAPPHLVRALSVSYYTGLRPGAVELFSLRWSDIDWDGRAILIRSAKKGGPRMRLLPIHKDFLDQLRRWYEEDRKPGGHIIHYRGRPIKRMHKAFQTAKKKAGISRRLRPYDFRHAFATTLLRQRSDLKGTSELLGHSRPDTTMRIYQHTDLELHRHIIGLLPALDGIGRKKDIS